MAASGRRIGAAAVWGATLAVGVWLALRAFWPAAPLRVDMDLAAAAGGSAADGGGALFVPPDPPQTERLYPRSRDDAFQAVYESRLDETAVREHYAAAFAGAGFVPEAGPAAVDALAFRRGPWRAELRFFPPEPPLASEYYLSVRRLRAAGRAPTGPEREP